MNEEYNEDIWIIIIAIALTLALVAVAWFGIR